MVTYHHNNSLALICNANTSSTIGSLVPYILTHARRTIDGGWESVVGERAGTALPAIFFCAVGAVAGTETCTKSAAYEVAFIEGDVWDRAADQSQQGEGRRDRETHVLEF